MTRIFLAAGLLAGCASQQTATSLADLQKQYGDVSLEVVATGDLSIEMHVASPGACPLIGNDVAATFDGANMQVLRGGPDTDASGCYPIAFWFDVLPSAMVNNFEVATTRSELVVADASATWTIDTVKLFANDFVVDQNAATITWADVASISDAQVQPPAAVQIAGNVIHFPAGDTIAAVQAHSTPATSRCDGPQVCSVDLEGGRQLIATPQ
ncbi:MAG TPA: hypothetical protein VMJ10_20665 [Kofleriaceae bacterium]|nr:hypothetical protein [Kofleriaceae bacterium]